MAARGGEERPLGMMVPAAAGVEIPPEPPDVGARTLAVASRLLCGATTFFFLAFVFAYFYLRSINQEHMWRPPHIKPDQGMGVVFVACIVLSVVLSIVAGHASKRGARGWTTAGALAVLLGLVAVAAQCIGYTKQNFGPTNGAFASVFVAWTGFYLIAVLFTMYWLETQVATEMRARRAPAASGDVAKPDELIAPGMDAAVFYWTFLGAIGVLTYVVLYLL